MTTQKIVNFNTLSRLGLIWKINKEILHPLGLALSRNKDGKWEYSSETGIERRKAVRYEHTLSMAESGELLKFLNAQGVI